MTRFQFKPDSNRKQKRTDQRAAEQQEREDKRKTGSRGGAPQPANGRARPARGGGRPGAKGKMRDEAHVDKRGMQGGRVEADPQPAKDGFASHLRQTARDMGLFEKLDPEPAPLALLDYETELELKTAAIRSWWTLHALPDKPTRVVASPLPRHYRSTSKRRLIWKGSGWKWDFFLERLGGIARSNDGGGIGSLEPAAHEAVYKRALEKLNEDSYKPLATSLNFLIVRGHPDLMVIFNVFRLNADVVRKAGLLAEHLAKVETGKDGRVVAAHIFFDKTRSDYYLEARVSEGAFRIKRLFGPEFLPVTVDNRRFLLHPTGFFQVNPSILPRVMAEVQNALKPRKDDRLLDLYCGCGLFTLPAAEACATAHGIEGSPVSIEAAQRAAGAAHIRNARFTAGRIDAKSLARLLPAADETPEILLLDPPRQGTTPGVLPLLAARKPRRVAYLFCDMNTMPAEISRWRKLGYMVAKAVPFDMFPGTNNLEMLVVLLPDKYGILNRKKPKVDPVDEEESAVHSSRFTVNTGKKRPGGSSKPGYVPKNKATPKKGKR
jgi:tRNA/tmRNA/rRNA uracil-C5-methylase (TrmA/RlmC/RlmD family)